EQDDQRIRAETGRAADLTLAGQVAEELRGVLRHRYPGIEQHVPPGRCRGDADHPSSSTRAPRVSHADGGVGLAGPGRADDQLGSLLTTEMGRALCSRVSDELRLDGQLRTGRIQ